VRALDATIDRLDRYQRRRPLLAFPVAVVKKFGDDRAGYLAALIAYFGFFSIFLLLMVFVTVLGFVLHGNPSLQRSIVHSVLGQFPVIGQKIRVHALRGNAVALAVGVVGTLWSGLGVVKAAQNAMDAVWNVPLKQRPNFLDSLWRALVMLVALGVAAVGATILSGIATGGGRFGVALKIVGLLAATALNFGVFMLAFRILTVARVSWRDVLPGAVVGAVAWEGLQLAGTYIVGTKLASASQVYGTFAFVIVLLSWLYLGAQVTLYAAEINVVRARRLWPRALRDQPGTDADEIALRRDAKQEERVDRETVEVGFRTDGGELPEGTKPIGGGAMEERKTEQIPAKGVQDQSTLQLVRSIATDTGALVRKEVELAKQEILEAVVARLKAAGAFGAAGMFGLLGLIFGCVAALAGLSLVVAPWLAALVVMGSLFLLAGLAAGFGAARIKTPPMAPTETVRTVKEDVQWARTQLKR
jgi:YihY family inner membrane protein